MELLKKCPFCGGEVELFETKEHQFEIWHKENRDVECPIDTTECVGGWIYDTKEHVIAAWNTRKPVERIVERLEELADSHNFSSDKKDIAKYIAYKRAIEIVKEEI